MQEWIVSNNRSCKMLLSKFLTISTAVAGLILILPAPSDAQQARPTARDHRTTSQPSANVRDHRKAASSAVKPSAEKRKSSTCVQSLVGGPSLCSGGKVLAGPIKPPQTIFREMQSKIKKRSQTVDHRKK
jgi:hypothetical protein